VLGEGLIVRVAVNENRHERGDAVRATFVRRWVGGCA
jgi:hypothetical protein